MSEWDAFPTAAAGWDAFPAAQPSGGAGSLWGNIKSIPGGIVQGIASAAAPLAQATQGEMGQSVDAPDAPQTAQAIEKNVTGALPNEGPYGRTLGEFIGNPGSYVGPGGIVRKAVTAAISGLGSEAAGQASQGTGAEPIARIIGAIASPAAAERAAVRTAASVAPAASELKNAASAGYDAARNAGIEIKPQSVQDFATRVRSDLEQRLGVDENLAPKTHAILQKVAAGPAAADGAVATVDNLQSLRRTLGNAAGSIDKTERMAASTAKTALDDYLSNLPASDVIAGNPQAASALLRDANANYAAASRSEAVNAKLVRAELRAAAANSGQNVANTIRQRMADILINPSLQRGYSPAELQQIEKIVRGTFVGNSARVVKNIFGGGGGLGTLATAGVGAAAGGLPGIALAAPGFAGRMIADRSTMRQVGKLDEMLRSRSPLGQQQAASARQQAAPPPNLNLLRALLLSNAAMQPMRQQIGVAP